MRDLLKKQRQFMIFFLGGILSAIADIGLMQLLINAGQPVAAATTAGYASGLIVNYAFHAKVTFQSSAVSANFFRYACLVALNYFLTLTCVSLALAVIGTAVIGKFASLPIVALNTFFLGKYWVFKSH